MFQSKFETLSYIATHPTHRKVLLVGVGLFVIGVSLMVVGMVGSHGGKKPVVETAPAYTPQFPLSVTGTVVSSNSGGNGTVWVETTIGHNVYQYDKCSGSPDLLAKGEGGSINFSFDATAGCYYEEAATHNSDLDTKD